ncbi:MAG: glycosyltransferase [Cyanobacteria bacterium P01_G01_bin.19]
MNQHDRRILIFELSVGGHYPEYISYLVTYWCEQQLSGSLYVIVIPKFLEQHPDVVAIPANYRTNNVEFISLTPEEQAKLKPYRSGIDRQVRAWQEFNLLDKYASSLQVDRAFIPYFDTRMLPLALGKSLPCSFSGIYFRPSFHYPNFSGDRPSLKEKLQHLREKIILSGVLQHRNLETLYSLDPFAVEPINCLGERQIAEPLPDPVKIHRSSTERTAMKSKLGIENNRQVHLLFGDLNKRKGIDQVLAAVALLPRKLASQLCLLLVGSMSEENLLRLQKQIDRVCRSTPVQIVRHNQYIPEEDIQNYFEVADVILAPYQRHVGMSGILNRAAVAQKPVLSSDYGLMGEITRRYQLGLTVDSQSPQKIAKGLSKFLQESPDEQCNYQQMALFARQNSVAKFASKIFDNLQTSSLKV